METTLKTASNNYDDEYYTDEYNIEMNEVQVHNPMDGTGFELNHGDNEDSTLQILFGKIDLDNSGTVDRSELKQILIDLQNGAANPETATINPLITDEEIDTILDRIDQDGDGSIDFHEFQTAFGGVQNLEELVDTSYLHLLFSRIDKDNSDSIDHDEILQLFANTDMTASDKQKILSLIDQDGDGTISFSEFKHAFRSLGCKNEDDLIEKSYLRIVYNNIDVNKNKKLELEEWRDLFLQQDINMTEHEMRRLIDAIDENQDGHIDFYEFEKAFKKVKSIKDLIKKSRLHVIFNRIDTDGSNTLDFDEIKLLFQQEQVNINDENLQMMIGLIDKNNDGHIDFDEFEEAFDEIESIDELITKWQSLQSVDVGSDLSVAGALYGEELSLKTLMPIIAGGCGGIMSRTATAPLERVKIMAQCGTTSISIVSTWKNIIEAQGFLRGLWRGNLVNCLRVFPFAGCVTFSYGKITKCMPQNLTEKDKAAHFYRFGAGVVAGGIATSLVRLF